VLGNCKVVHALNRERKLLLRPAEHNLPNFTPLQWIKVVDKQNFWASI
jgi:hypothetical protein